MNNQPKPTPRELEIAKEVATAWWQTAMDYAPLEQSIAAALAAYREEVREEERRDINDLWRVLNGVVELAEAWHRHLSAKMAPHENRLIAETLGEARKTLADVDLRIRDRIRARAESGGSDG